MESTCDQYFQTRYPHVLEKKTQNDFLFCGNPMSKQQFLAGMRRCGFDMDITRNTVRCMAIDGIWRLSLTAKELRLIFAKKRSSGLGFAS